MSESAHLYSIDQLSGLRHDLRTQVGIVLGYAELVSLNTSVREKPDILTDVEKIRIAGNAILKMLGERLNTATLETEPLARSATTFVEIPTVPNAKDTTTATGRLLVVDDNAENRTVLARRLRQLGHIVETDPGGAEALARLASEEFELVLLDVMMPDLDGREVLSRIKLNPKTQHVPVIMISALDEMQIIVQCIEMGAADYLSKPFDPVLLRARVSACLRDKRFHDRELQFTSELQESYRRLKEAEKLKDDLTHMIIHDLRTPLSSLMTGMQTIPMLGDLTEVQVEMVDIAVAGGQKLLDLITDLLDVDKMEAGAMKLNYAPVSVVSLLEAAATSVRPLVEGQGLNLVQDVDMGLPEVQGDEDFLHRVLVNLLGNAIKFTPSGGTITLCARMSDDRASLKFSVTDTGEGIPTESFHRIFEKFGQVEGQTKGRKISTGLGLTFCKMAVEAHHGHIEVESVPGSGCTFSFYIPI